MHPRPLLVFATAVALCHAAGAQEFQPETIIALERAALDRWGNGDPEGYLEIFADDVTYFDPTTQRRVDGIGAMRALSTPIKGLVKLTRYEIQNPDVYRRGDLAVLSFNLVTYGLRANGETVTSRWNTTEVYGLIGGKWKIVHSHFSYMQPQLASPNSE